MSEGKFALGGLALLALWLFFGLPLLSHPLEATEFLGLSAEGWTAIWTFGLTAATVALTVVAGYQISAARDEAKRSRTLAACNLYDTDPVLDASCRRLRDGKDSGDLERNPRNYRLELWTVMNYLEGIAIGVDERLYDKTIVHSYLGTIIVGTVDEYLVSGLAERADHMESTERDPDEFGGITELANEWRRKGHA